jgi:hypothetical protein
VLSYSFAGYFDVQSKSGKLVIIKEADEDGYLGSIENYLRVAYSWLCIERDGFLLHACGIIRKGKAYVFFGPSESGKTTVAMLSLYSDDLSRRNTKRNLSILSDDLVIVRRINPHRPSFPLTKGRGHERSGQGGCGKGETRAFGVPFRGSAPFLFLNKNENAPIAGFFELHKSDFFRLEKLSRPLAVAKLVSNIPFLEGKKMLSEKMISVCNDVISDIPCYTMYFTKDGSFWQELGDILPS